MRTMPRPLGYHWDRKTMVVRPDGQRACRWCKGAVPKPRRTFCSDACVEQWKFRTDVDTFRLVVYRRDHGVCALCGFDTKTVDDLWLRRQLKLTELAMRRHGDDWREWKEVPSLQPDGALWPLDHWGRLIGNAAVWQSTNKIPLGQSPWQADHVVEIADGGDWFDLSNVQTACTPCHRRKSAESTTARARRRREPKLVLPGLREE